MIEIKNTDNIVILENNSEIETDRVHVRLNLDKGFLLPKNSTYQFDTGIEVICSAENEEVYVELPPVSVCGYIAEEFRINKGTNSRLIINMENLSSDGIYITPNKIIATLYKYLKYNEKEGFGVIYDQNGIVVGEKIDNKQYIAKNVEVYYLEDDKRKLIMDIVPV